MNYVCIRGQKNKHEPCLEKEKDINAGVSKSELQIQMWQHLSAIKDGK